MTSQQNMVFKEDGKATVDISDLSQRMSNAFSQKPPWLKVRLPTDGAYWQIKEIMSELDLCTVCESAACPNRGECWSQLTATLMLLGNICTRSCGFCNVAAGRPTLVDLDEPRRVAEAVERLQLKYVVITSVSRDDLADGGASIFADTICQIRSRCPETRIEVLIPDFGGIVESLKLVIDASPDVLSHNLETVPRLYSRVRPQARFERSLELLQEAKRSGLTTKSSLMLGLGETCEEVVAVLRSLKSVNCDLLTLGQYMRPTKYHLPVERFVSKEEFEELRKQGEQMGFRGVFSGPLVRSSYHASAQAALL